MSYEINMNRNAIDIKRLENLLRSTYWASDRSLSDIVKSIEHSECVCVYDQDKLIGFARIVTDYTTMFWICDVVVDEEYRNKGIGKKIMTYISELDFYKPLKGILATRDAFGLYEKFGFKKEPSKFMSKDRGV